MRFSKSFTRWVGDPSGRSPFVMLGDDAPPAVEADMHRDCAFQTPQTNIHGFPVQRVVVAYRGPEPELAATAWIYDELTRAWYQATMSGPLLSGRFAAIDTPCVLDAGASRSPVEVYLCVEPEPTAAAGEYVFAFAADVSNPGL